MTDTNKITRKYHGHEIKGGYYFADMGCECEDADPRVAFAQMMYTI